MPTFAHRPTVELAVKPIPRPTFGRPRRAATTSPAAATGSGAASTAPLRRGAWLLPMAGALLLWATFEHQPDPSTEFGDWARFVTTDAFLAQHLAGSILGQVLWLIGVAALAGVILAAGRRTRTAISGFVLTTLGAAGLLAGFGAAAFAQPAIGHLQNAGVPGAHALYDDVYGVPTFAVLLGGTALFSLGSIVLARAAGAIAGTPMWARLAFGASGPLIGVLGVMFGPFQTAGSVAAVVGGASLAWSVRRA